jgi:AcrR family transcriptional regulator
VGPAPASDAAPEPLGERLVDQALRLLAREGIEALSLRRLARRAGVSHGAPLRHFRSLADLRAEVAARGFARLFDAVERAAESLPAGSGPLARLAAAGRAYVKLAVEQPGLFALMFRPDQLDLENLAFRTRAPAAFEQLVRLVRAAQDAGWHARRDTRQLAGSVWAAVHGLATLWSQGGMLVPLRGSTLEQVLETTLELVLEDRRGGTP